MIRTWVTTEDFPRDIIRGFRRLNFDDRVVWEYFGGSDWKIIYSNQTCMRNIEVVVLDEGYVRFI